ncbi:periplasmic nitrate reductase, NapE protein [Marilutibacter chinensis]|uniref:Periplasmic nitrate reductase, NapE protein n=1 Tax=Marilutibacter chinensis TaxID=2912247 RepID=A0ABS9HWW2_9GAMM|nr:periplasmic nitrate reductase, NapE protein [Lysobacter chinensis]MCF7223375.1 periplasmic nitrate reductase, NapE protein [Lysobacter chinensis]
MRSGSQAPPAEPGVEPRKTQRAELTVFLLITVVIFPVLAVGLVAAYGFSVWIWQMFNGPPGA